MTIPSLMPYYHQTPWIKTEISKDPNFDPPPSPLSSLYYALRHELYQAEQINDMARKHVLEHDLEIVKQLSQDNLSLNAPQDANDNTWLHLAKTPELVSYLILAGAMIDTRNSLEQTPLHRRNETESISLLLKAGANPNSQDIYGRTPLHYADGSAYGEVVDLLLKAQADPYLQDISGKIPVEYIHEDMNRRHILLTGMLDVLHQELSFLLNNTLTAWDQDSAKHLPLEKKTWDTKIRAVDMELKLIHHIRSSHQQMMNLDVNRFKNGNSFLHIAKYPGTISWLLAAGADIHSKNDLGQTPLHTCTGHQSLEILIKAKANVYVQDLNGKTPLHYAVALKEEKNTTALLKAGADPNLQDFNGRAPLHYITSNSGPKKISSLLKAGADPNLQDLHGNTPLHSHKILHSVECVRALLKAKTINPSIPNKSGNTPLSLSPSTQPKVILALKKHPCCYD